MPKKLTRFSKWIHKYFGLILALFTIWMSISGILLNHPDWITGLSAPNWLVPNNYIPVNWNRSALISAVFSEKNNQTVFAAGKQGIWRSVDGGETFERFEKNFESSPYFKKTKNLFLLEKENPLLFAATDGGLYKCDLRTTLWEKIPLSYANEAARKILQIGERLIVVSESGFYFAELNRDDLQFKKIDTQRFEKEKSVTLVDFFFHLHSGSIWELPGKLLFDFAGLILLFLSLSAIYIWYFPNALKRHKKNKHTKLNRRPFKFFYKYHLKLGIYSALIFLIMGATGFFMRPPALAVIATGSVPAVYYPGFLPENPWYKTIHNALYDPVTDQIIVNTKNGEWIGPADFNEPFKKTELNTPLFVMGAPVFDAYGQGGYIVGSFNGIYHLERTTNKPFDMLEKEYIEDWSNVRPADYMVTGYFKTPAGFEFITSHEQGLKQLEILSEENNRMFQMPQQLVNEYRMPLWNFMFELHNGRLFKAWLGGFYILLVPLGSLMFVLLSLSGIYDWVVYKISKRRKLATE